MCQNIFIMKKSVFLLMMFIFGVCTSHQVDAQSFGKLLSKGPYTAHTGDITNYSIYEKAIVETNVKNESRTYHFKGFTSFEGKKYRNYRYNDRTYILLEPNGGSLIWFSSNDTGSRFRFNYTKGKKTSKPSTSSSASNSLNVYPGTIYPQQNAQPQRCMACRGTGRMEAYGYSQGGFFYCSECGQRKPNGHYHRNCPGCNGTGIIR